MKRVLAADVGGTKSWLEVLELRDGVWTPVLDRRYESALFPDCDSLLREFLAMTGPVDAACLAVAGPVVAGGAHVTNLRWNIVAERLTEAFSIPRTLLVNDFYAVAAGVPLLGPDDLVAVNDRPRDPAGSIAILGAGTGLGEALVIPTDGDWQILPSEGGHADFAPSTAEQDGLLAHLRARYGHVSWERVLSGSGLVNIFTYLRDARPDLAPSDFTDGFEGHDFAAAIAEHDAKGNLLARATFDVFIDVYGAEAGNAAVRALTSGGVFLAGGICAKNASRFTDGRFLEAYAAKGRFRDMLLGWPVYVIMNPRVGLIGAAHLATRLGE